ncbi:MAG: CsgG/HfaB family protein [Planctomycetes bacterium]|nr:CsgG/HfaB family protein [Planctomycetota bacterium]MBU1517818.1 CsgG/HfaB family protein [Planctomycetota bacterium]MBU2457394.1 CsgG/HfaB family protein [Planctomycetota bacterium]
MKKAYILFVIFFGIFAQFSFATETIIKETKGIGKTRQQAIKNALAQAIGQASGVEISTPDEELLEIDSDNNIQIGTISAEHNQDDYKAKINGFVKTYDILSEKRTGDDLYEVSLKVWVYKYESEAPDNLKKIAIMPTKTLKENYHFKDTTVSAKDLSENLQSKLTKAFAETNKFTVLDRQYISDFLRNRDMITEGQGKTEEKAKLNNVLGADYMFSSTISNAKLTARQKYLKAIQRKSWEYKLDFILDYEIISAPTTKVISADSIKIYLDTNEIKELVEEWDHENLNIPELIDNLLVKIANKAAKNATEKLFPVKITAITSNDKIVQDTNEIDTINTSTTHQTIDKK